MKRITAFAIVTALLFLLCACGHVHSWTEADCTSPRTCSSCGQTQGEALGHRWQEATCTAPKTCLRCGVTESAPLGHDWTKATCAAPKTCLRCGETEGEPLPHTPTEADYQHPSVCSVCGAVCGPALEADFVKYGFDRFCETGVSYPYKTLSKGRDREITGTFEVTSYVITKGDGDKLEVTEGYEWRVVAFTASFPAADAEPKVIFDDYYDSLLMNETCGPDTVGGAAWRVHWDGSLLRCNHREETLTEWNEDGSKTCSWIWYFHVPEGYDGVVIGAAKPTAGSYAETRFDCFYEFCDEDSLFFRLA